MTDNERLEKLRVICEMLDDVRLDVGLGSHIISALVDARYSVHAVIRVYETR